MQIWRLTVLGETFVTATQLSVTGEETSVLHVLPYGVEHSESD